MRNYTTILKGFLAASAVSLLSVGTASAVGTAADTTVSNTFTLDYSVGGVDQPPIDTTGTPTNFTVDRVINLTVVSGGDNTVAPGATGEELVFTLTNTGNDTQAYTFELFNEAETVAAPGSPFDVNLTDFDITYYFGTDDSGTAITYDPADGFSSINVPADGQLYIVLQNNIPGTQVDADEASVTLLARTHEPHAVPANGNTVATTEVTADTDGVNTIDGAAENVLADGAADEAPGTSPYDRENANDGDFSATGTYIVASADLVAEKTVYVLSEDGSNCATIAPLPNNVDTSGGARDGLHIVPTNGFHAIPGACVEYRISATNRGSTAAANVAGINIADDLPDSLTFISAVQNGFTNATLGTPTGAAPVAGPAAGDGVDCATSTTAAPAPLTGTGCYVSLISTNTTPGNTTSNLAAGADGVIVIRARVK